MYLLISHRFSPMKLASLNDLEKVISEMTVHVKKETLKHKSRPQPHRTYA